MTDTTLDPNTATADEFETALDRLRAAFYAPLAKRLEKRVADLEAQAVELKRLHADATQLAVYAAEWERRAMAAEAKLPDRSRRCK